MKRIEVDFNSLAAEPEGLVDLGFVDEATQHGLPSLREGERVLLESDDHDVQVEATVVIYTTSWGRKVWMARPDESTYQNAPASASFSAEQGR